MTDSTPPARLHRYPGAQPFETDQKDLFFGREKDITELYRMIKLEKLVVLYSKSGLGKSSLLNAGIIPLTRAENEFLPIRIRFEAWMEGKKETPSFITRRVIAPAGSSSTFLDKLIENEDTLWHEIKEHQIEHSDKKGLLLIFDQFEELFTYPPEMVAQFKQELAEALYSTVPQRYANVLAEKFSKGETHLNAEELRLLQTPPETKVVMAIRSDRMSLLNQMADHLPNVLKNCYELNALDRAQAQAAILEPAHRQDAGLVTPQFDYAPTALDKILNYLTKNDTQRIESFQLQILCQFVEKKIKTAGQVIQPDDLGDVESLYENYYDDQIAHLEDPEEAHSARLLIEDALILEEEERRLSIYEGQLARSYDISRETLRKLVDSHLLRSEPSMQGGYTYELSHDTLVGPVLKAKRRRKEAEAIEHAREEEKKRQEELIQLKKHAAEQEQKRLEEETLRRRAEEATAKAERISKVAVAFAVLALFTFITTFIFYWQADKQKHRTEVANRQLNEKLVKIDMIEIEKLEKRGEGLRSTGFLKSAGEMFLAADSITHLHDTVPVMIEKHRVLERKIAECQRPAAKQ